METRWIHEDSVEYVIASTYAKSKSYLFQSFFGWRQTKSDGMARFVLTKRGWKMVDESIKYYYTFVKKD